MNEAETSVVTSQEFYDAIANEYSDISERRRGYLDGVDALVVTLASAGAPRAYLDVGCGDGRRTAKIASALSVASVVGVDESSAMLSYVARVETQQMSVQTLDNGRHFDLVTALWNVMGHIPQEERVPALNAIARTMQAEGKLYLDVNNRHNARAYGAEIVQRNKELEKEGLEVGNVNAAYEVEGRTVTTIGYVFHPEEIDGLVAQCPELQVTRKLFVDYDTGSPVGSPEAGQVFYEVTKRPILVRT